MDGIFADAATERQAPNLAHADSLEPQEMMIEGMLV